MDKRTIIIIIGLGVLVIFWIPIMTTLGLIEPSKQPVPSEISRDSLYTQPEETQKPDIYTDRPAEIAVDKKPMQETEVSVTDTLPQVLEDSIVIETNVQRIALSNYGGAPVSIQLKKYHYNDNGPIEMLPDCKISTPEIKQLKQSLKKSRRLIPS